MDDFAVLASTAELRPVRHPALQDRGEDVRVDRTGKPEVLGTLAGPGAGVTVIGSSFA